MIACTCFPKTCSKGTLPKEHSNTSADPFKAVIISLSGWRRSSETRSILLRMMALLHSTCSTSRSTTLRSTSTLFITSYASSCEIFCSSNPRSSTWSATSCLEEKRSKKCGESTTVIIADSFTKSNTGCPPRIASWNSRRTFLGSATPLISITIRSNLYPPTCATSRSWAMQAMSSSEALQHAQPFSSSTNSMPSPLLVRIPLLERSRTSFASMFTDATSFTTTPTRSPPLLVRSSCNSVVFPEPRNPDSSDIGTLSSGAAAGADIEPENEREKNSWAPPCRHAGLTGSVEQATRDVTARASERDASRSSIV
mmetsp:Transcript_43438/g.103274  ORF Transcript_43438/g.103274 Transcript_43438/m.103274 type:complete len:312 (+) Transcript_43438:830-1765(+)